MKLAVRLDFDETDLLKMDVEDLADAPRIIPTHK